MRPSPLPSGIGVLIDPASYRALGPSTALFLVFARRSPAAESCISFQEPRSSLCAVGSSRPTLSVSMLLIYRPVSLCALETARLILRLKREGTLHNCNVRLVFIESAATGIDHAADVAELARALY